MTHFQFWRIPAAIGACASLGVGLIWDAPIIAIALLPVFVIGFALLIAVVEAMFATPEQLEAAGLGPSKKSGTELADAGRRAKSKRAQALVDSYAPSMFDVPALMDAGDWDAARMAMQKLAYVMPREPASTQAEFKALMTLFASRDPLYAVAVAALKPAVLQQPGIRQTALYPLLAPLTTEEARYVLYFAAELGDLVRVKKGNSYLVYPSGYSLPG